MNRYIIEVLLTLYISLTLLSCTTAHIYVNHGEDGRAGPKAQADVESTIKGVENNE